MSSRRFDNDLLHEKDRLLAAWLKRQGYGAYDWMRMSDRELDEHRRRAEKSSLIIPRTERGYLYHGTSSTRATKIRTEGLVPDKKSVWDKSGYRLHRRGRVFVCDTIQKAHFYATEMSRTRPAILRIRSDALTDMRDDPLDEEGSFFVERTVPASDVDLWTPKGWQPGLEPDEPQETVSDEDAPSP